MRSLLELLRKIKHPCTHTHINLSLPLPNHWLAKRVLFPALISCQFVILLPGPIEFHRVWVYWLHREVYVVTEISLDGQGYGRGIRRARQCRGVGMAEMLGCLESSPRKIKAGSLQQQGTQWDTPEGGQLGCDCEPASSHSTHPPSPFPLQPSRCPQCQKSFPIQ